MRRVRRAGVRVFHLLGVPVVGGDEEDVSRLLRGFVDGADRLVGFGDGLYRGFKYTGVADLGGFE